MLLDDLLQRLDAMPTEQRAALARDALSATSALKWVPNPGPQYDAYVCEADELFFGGQAGPGKSDLGLGLATNKHARSLFLREFADDARSAADRFMEIQGDRRGWNGQLLRYADGKRLVDFGGCSAEQDKQRYKGDPHDLIVFDEVGDFTLSQYLFICAWNRTSDPKQRCRIVCTGNPPTRAKGLWVIERWAAWLDPRHPNPAKDGELRWYTTDDDGNEIEVDGPGPHTIGDRQVRARSRTFIRGTLADNPDLARTDYDATLSALPADLRAAYRDGSFSAALEDRPFQVIPTEWVQAAQRRWTERPLVGVPLCAIGLDPAQGGRDDNVLAKRHDGWYAPLTVVPGKDTPLGTDMSAFVFKHRRDDAQVIVDCGGGYGGSVYKHLKENGVPVRAYKGSEASVRRTIDSQLRFANKRTEVYWRFREALDPDQDGGSDIALPSQDRELLADLTEPTYEVRAGVIHMETKEHLVKRIGRSPGRGDAVTICWSDGPRAITHASLWRSGEQGPGRGGRYRRPQVKLGHEAVRQATRR